MSLWPLYIGWGIMAIFFLFVAVDHYSPKTKLPRTIHKPAMLLLGFFLTAGVGAIAYGAWARHKVRASPGKVSSKPLVLKGGTEEQAQQRKDEAEALVSKSEKADASVDDAILDLDSDVPPDDLMDRLRERGALGE